jgi:hypothetical protein
MMKSAKIGDVVEFFDNLGMVAEVAGSRLRAVMTTGDEFSAPLRLCNLKFSALSAEEREACWYEAPIDEAVEVARKLWPDEVMEVA